MKKTQWIDLWTTIKRNKVPYIAIVIFVALGIALYAGMSWSCTYIDKALDKTCAAARLAHMRVVYPYGVSDNQINELLAIDGVDDVEGYNFIYRFFDQNGERCQAIVYQLTEHVGAPTVVEGTLPAKENEIAVLSSWAGDYNVKIGDTITFIDEHASDYREVQSVLAVAGWDPDSGEQPDTTTSDPGYLKTNTFTVTALVKSPEYLLGMRSSYGSNTMNGVQVDAVMYVSKNAMDPEVFNGYTAAAIYSDTLAAMNDGSDAYDTTYDALQAAVKAVTDNWTAVPDSYISTLRNFWDKLQSAAEQLSGVVDEIESMEYELDKGQADLADGQATLDEKEQEYADAKAEYESKLAQADQASVKLKSAWDIYDCLKADVAAVKPLKNDVEAFLAVMAEDDPSGETVTVEPTVTATVEPTDTATVEPTDTATVEPTDTATIEPTDTATVEPTNTVTAEPTEAVTVEPTEVVTEEPTEAVTEEPTEAVTAEPTEAVTAEPTEVVTAEPTEAVTAEPTEVVTAEPTEAVTAEPTEAVTAEPTEAVTEEPAEAVTEEPTEVATKEPTEAATAEPTEAVTAEPTNTATPQPTEAVTEEPSESEEKSANAVTLKAGPSHPSRDNTVWFSPAVVTKKAIHSKSKKDSADSEESSDEQPSGGEEEPSEDVTNAATAEPSGSETDPAGEGDPSLEERQQAAFEAVKTSATKLFKLLNSQSGKFSKMKSLLGKELKIDVLTSAVNSMMEAKTPEALESAINAAGDWFGKTFSNLDPDALLAKMKKKLDANKKKLNEAYTKLNEAADQLSEAQKQLDEGHEQLESSASQISEGAKTIDEAWEEFAEKQTEYDDSESLYTQMDAASATVYGISPTVFTRTSNIALASATGIRGVIENARTTLAFMFLIVAVLVGYTTLSRMVADTTLQVGTKKALGFNRWEVLRLYLLYVVTAVLIGALLGTAGAYGVEMMFNSTFAGMFEVEETPAVITLLPALFPFAAELLMLTVVAVLATLRQLSRKAIDLLKGTTENATPKKHPPRFQLFANMPLFDRIVLANLRQDKRRVIAMLVGIGGSAMLVTAGLTCLVNMSRSISYQFKDYYQFDTIVRYESTDENASDEVRTLLERYGAKYAEVSYTHVLITVDKSQTRIADVFIPADTEEFSQIVRFSDENGKRTEYTGGLWASDSLYGKQKMKTGDTLTLQSLTGVSKDFAISGFYREYLPSLNFVIDAKTWEDAYSDATPNAYLISTDNIDSEGLLKELSGLDGYICAIAYRENLVSTFKSILAVIFAISAIFTVMAVLLLFMLLINLLDMDIAEKKRELIILKINGYSTRKVKQYIWKDTLLLCVLGIIVGILLGTTAGNFTQSALEGTTMQMYHGISWTACLIAVAITSTMALIITLIELKKVDRFRLSDINN